MKNKQKLIIATRQSPLALWQTEYVKAQLQQHHPDITVEILGKTTEGDRKKDVALNKIGGKNLFAKELQQLLISGQADIAVHSIKDLSVTQPKGLQLACVCKRADPRDAFLAIKHESLNALPNNAIIGTASPRRQCQLLALRPDLQIKLLRGNVGTRLAKLAAGEFDAILLAAAGLTRLKLEQQITEYLDPSLFIPAIGQGAIGIECREDNEEACNLLAPLNDTETAICIEAERAVNRILGGDCFTPIGAHATIEKNTLTLNAMVGALDGSRVINASKSGKLAEATTLGSDVAETLLIDGAKELLNL